MKPLPILITACVLGSCRKPEQIRLQIKDIIETVYASGKITSGNEYSLVALGSGAILEKKVKDGDRVRKGQILYIVHYEPAAARYQAALDNLHNTELNLGSRSPLLNDLRLTLESAALRRKNDSINYHRWKTLWEQGIGTRSNLDDAYTNFQISTNQQNSAEEKYNNALHDLKVNNSNAKSQVQTARKELDDNFITAGKDGVVWQTFKETGEAVRTNDLVAIIGDSNSIIRLAVDQEDISKIKTGQKVLLKTDMTGDSVFEAAITRIYPAMNESDRTFRVDAEFLGSHPPAYIHSSVEANIIIAEKHNAAVLPREALTSGDSAWILDKGKEKKIAIATGLSTMEYIEILSGIDRNTTVIIKDLTEKR